ncbi:MAG: urea ABC transporter permease subunit UrtB [Pseudomonadota bacterium]
MALYRVGRIISLLCCLLIASSLAAQTVRSAPSLDAEVSVSGQLEAGEVSPTETLESLLERLVAAPSKERGLVFESIAQLDDSRVTRFFELLFEGSLYINRKSQSVVKGKRVGSSIEASDLFSDEALENLRRRDVRRLSVNNQLRLRLLELRAIKVVSLAGPTDKSDTLRQAVETLLASPSAVSIEALRARSSVEQNSEIRERLALAVALSDLESSDAALVEDALAVLARNASPRVRIALEDVSQRADLSDELRSKSASLLRKAESRQRWMERIQAAFFGLSLGSVLLLSAIGLAITFGVMGVINMAHGELIMLGAYTCWVLQQWLPAYPGVALLIAIPAAFLVSGAMGLLIERSVISHLYGRPLETLLATFGISLILQQTVRSVFSPLNRSVVTPDWLLGAWELSPGLSLTYNRLAILAFSLLVFTLLLLLFKRTRLGLEVRAVSQNREMARALGIRSARVDAMTFALGSGVAGIAGVALSQLTNVGPNLGQGYIIDSFLVVVFGGVGNLWGTFNAAFALGVANKLLEPSTGAVLAKITILVALILFLQRKPEGLFPQKGRR